MRFRRRLSSSRSSKPWIARGIGFWWSPAGNRSIACDVNTEGRTTHRADHVIVETSDPEERQEATREALRALPSHQSHALLLKYVNGLSTEEVSRVIGKSMQATIAFCSERARVARRPDTRVSR